MGELKSFSILDGGIECFGVRDSIDGISVWWPREDAQQEIQAAKNPEKAAIEICQFKPSRGDWHN